MHGPISSEQLLKAIEWSGEGSVLAGRAALVLWHRSGHPTQVADAGAMRMSGLVRGEVEFFRPNDNAPAACRIVSWEVPLRSTEPPGIGKAGLFMPSWNRGDDGEDGSSLDDRPGP